MNDHRIRLTDADIALIVASLNARRAMTTRARRAHIVNLVTRLSDGGRGNPNFRFDLADESDAAYRELCVHEIPLTDTCSACRARTRRLTGLPVR